MSVEGAETTRPAEVWVRAGEAFRRWCEGDAVALDELVAAMTPVLWHVVRAYRLPTQVAEDVVQTTWLALVRSREAVADPTAVGGWLTTTARREAWRVARAGGRALPVEDDELTRRMPEEESAEQGVVRRDEDRRLWAAVERLSERCQLLLRIVAFEHRPDYTRIAAELGMPVGSIGPTRGRCLAKLRDVLAEGGVMAQERDEFTEVEREDVLAVVRTVAEQRDPVPEGLVARVQAAAALAAAEVGGDLDLELMLLVERSDELAGTRGTGTAYTLRFTHDGLDLLLRVNGTRVDGWVVPPTPLTVHVQRDGRPGDGQAEVDATGRFELRDLAGGVLRLRLEPHDGSTPFLTPAFEI